MALTSEPLVLKFRPVLAASERVAPADRGPARRALLARLIAHARDTTPFYRDRLRGLDVADLDIDHPAWRALPLLSRKEVQAHRERLAATRVPAEAGAVTSGETSGSTGRPLRYLENMLAGAASHAQTDRLMRWWNVDGNKTLCVFDASHAAAGQPDDPGGTGWRPGFPHGWSYDFDLLADLDRQIEWLSRKKPAYVLTRGSAAGALATRALKTGRSLALDLVMTISTPVTPDAREATRAAFACEIADSYGAKETGLLALGCPDCGAYHLCEETVAVEVLRADGVPCAEGETGRVVITSLYNHAMPLIRYEIGDYAEVGPAVASCGRTLPTLTRIVGRYRNVFTLRDGRQLYPYVYASKYEPHLSFEQIQFVQTDFDHIEIRYVPGPVGKPANLPAIEALVRRYFDASFTVSLKALDAMPVLASGKFEETISLVSSGP